jgi:hypothetical protein
MQKYRAESPGVKNQTLGQKATLTMDSGPRLLLVDHIITVTKTGATAGTVFQPKVAEFLDLIDSQINKKSARQHTALELDAIQTRYSPLLSIVQYDQLANDLVTAVPDVVVGANTTRTTTFVVTTCFMEPSRDSYTAREAFAWPTKWASGKTAEVKFVYTLLATAEAAGYSNLVMRAEHDFDNVLGPVVNGKDAMYVTHWYRFDEDYSSTKVTVEKWSYPLDDEGQLQQLDVFSPAGDDVATFEYKGDEVVLKTGSKATIDINATRYGFNPLGVNADRFTLPFDYTDDPSDQLPLAKYTKHRLNLVLTQAAAQNKNLIVIAQVWRNAFA